jgi:hypothetical protein
MPDDAIAPRADTTGLITELYQAAYDFALRHGFQGTLVEVQFGLMDALRARARGVAPGELRCAEAEEGPCGVPRAVTRRKSSD